MLFTHPVIANLIFHWAFFVAISLIIFLVYFKKKDFNFVTTFTDSLLLSYSFGIVLNFLAVVVAILLPGHILTFAAKTADSMYYSYLSVFSIWFVFWYLMGIPLAFLFKGISRRSHLFKTSLIISFVVFVIFSVGVIGINKLRNYYKSCPQSFVCQRV